MGKQLVNVPVVLKAPGKEAGRAQHSHSRAAWPSTATAQPSTQPPRGQTRARPTSPLLSPWSLAGGHRRAAETPLNMHPQCPLSKASACVQLAWSAAPRPREPEERDLWIQSTWPRACFHCFLLRSPLLLPPLQTPFLTLPALCSAHPPQPCRPLPAPWGASTQPACFPVTGTVTPHLLYDACPRRAAQSTASAGGHIRMSGAAGDHG